MPRTVALPADVGLIRDELAPKLAPLRHRRDKTHLVADHLFFTRSIYPSAAIVRSITQQGSLTDINEDLQQFWADVRSQVKPSTASTPGVPDHLASAFGPAIESMWLAALDAANASLAAVKQSYASSVEDAIRHADVQRRLVDEGRNRIAHLEAQLEQGRALASALGEQIAQLRAELALADERIQRLTSDRQASDDARAQLQSLLAEGLEGLRKSSDKASDSFLGEIRYLKLQLDAARSAERDLREQVQASRQATSLELQILRQQNNGLLETNGRLNLHNQDLTQQLAAALSR